MTKEIHSVDQLKEIEKEHDAVLLYFSTQSCNVCKALKPTVHKLINEKFSKIKFFSVFSEQHPDIAAQYNVFVAPTIVILFSGKEFIRKSRNISLVELESEISRLYQMQFG